VIALTAIVSASQRQPVVAWTEITRRNYRRDRPRYASDIADAEWVVIDPLMPPSAACQQRRETGIRSLVNAIFYIVQTGAIGACCPAISCPSPRFSGSSMLRATRGVGRLPIARC